jgi:SAM-dependent methyltransferase
MDDRAYTLQYQVEKEHWWYRARKEILLHYLDRRLGGRRGMSLLDVGCGTGALLEALAGRYQAVGLEPSERAVEFCRLRGLSMVRQGTPETYVPPRRFDLATMFDVLEHIPDDAGTLRRIHGFLTPGGHLLLTVPAYRFLWSPQDDAVHHLRRYTLRPLRALVEAAGFTVLHMTFFNTLLFPAALVRRLTARGVPDEALRDLELPGPALNRLLHAVFAFERHIVPHMTLPFGLSLLCWAARPGEAGVPSITPVNKEPSP